MCETVSVELETIYPVIKEKFSAGGSVTFSPKGISMLPLIRQGVDSVKISPVKGKLKKYDVPLYKRTNGQFVLHRVVAVRGNSYVMCGDNQTFREYGINHSQIIGVMSEVIKPDSIVKVTDKKYITYSKKQVFKQRIKYYIVKTKAIIKAVLIKLHLYK
ncbi:MAG: S24/S26 family peptidase [Clostridia bacterium]|nr:S24/S26 family peptidase [Clostridia bacterium]